MGKNTIDSSNSSICTGKHQQVKTGDSKLYYSTIVTCNTSLLPRGKNNTTTTPTNNTLLYWDSTHARNLFEDVSSEVNPHIIVLKQIKPLTDPLDTHDGCLQVIAQNKNIDDEDISNYEI